MPEGMELLELAASKRSMEGFSLSLLEGEGLFGKLGEEA